MSSGENLGVWLKARRETLGFTLRDVERVTGGKVSNAYLSQIENGHVESPSAITLHRLAAAYGLDFGETLERAGDSSPPPPPIICPVCGQARPSPKETGDTPESGHAD